jgi:sulfane dehydrogenase subunit SoxC
MMNSDLRIAGRITPAPEAPKPPSRRRFLASALAAGAGGVAAGRAAAQQRGPVEASGVDGPGESAILSLPEHTRGLGQPVAARGYGLPSQWEKGLQRRESPGLTRVVGHRSQPAPADGERPGARSEGLHHG